MKSCIKKGKMKLQRLLYFVRGNEDKNVPSLSVSDILSQTRSERQKHMCAPEICNCNALAHLTWKEGLANFAQNASRSRACVAAVVAFCSWMPYFKTCKSRKNRVCPKRGLAGKGLSRRGSGQRNPYSHQLNMPFHPPSLAGDISMGFGKFASGSNAVGSLRGRLSEGNEIE